MFKWNPFARESQPASQPEQAASQGETLPNNADLLAAIEDARLDTLMGDMRPLHRVILGSELLMPLHEPPMETPQGTKLRYMTFEDDSVMLVFTDAAHLKEFFGDTNPIGGTRMCVIPMSGQDICRAATSSEMRKIIINPNADVLYVMPPLVYRVLAEGFIPGSVSDEAIPAGELIIARPISGLPDDEMMQAWREVLSQNGVTEAYWFNLIIPDRNELRYSFAVGCEEEQLKKIHSDLVGAWLGKWPVNTPLYVCRLEDDETSCAVREGGAPMFE